MKFYIYLCYYKKVLFLAALKFNNDDTKLVWMSEDGKLWIGDLLTSHVQSYCLPDYSISYGPDLLVNIFFDALNNLIVMYPDKTYHIPSQSLDFIFDSSAILKLGLALLKKPPQNSKDLEVYNKRFQEIITILTLHRSQEDYEQPAKKRKIYNDQ